jgi:hypothetical protein
VRKAVIEPAAADAAFTLDQDALALGRGELHGIAEALLAHMRRAAVNVGMVEDGHARIDGGMDQFVDFVVRHFGDAHQPDDNAGDRLAGDRMLEGLHDGGTPVEWVSERYSGMRTATMRRGPSPLDSALQESSDELLLEQQEQDDRRRQY